MVSENQHIELEKIEIDVLTMKSSGALKENVPPSTGKSKIPRKIAGKGKDEKTSMLPSASQTKKKYAGVVPSDSPKRILGELPREQGQITKVRKLQKELSAPQTEGVKQEKGKLGKSGASNDDEDFVKDDSALQSILDETGIQDIPQQTVVPHRHTMATSRTPRQSFFTGSRRETGFKDFQRLCDDFVRRTSTIKPQLKRQCMEKTEAVKTPKKMVASFFPTTPAASPFQIASFTPRASAGPTRVQVEKSMFGLDVKGSPGSCHTPIRTPIKKEILSFTAQRVPRPDGKDTPKPVRLAVTSVKKKKQLTWADALEDCRSPELTRSTAISGGGPTKGKKSLFCGQEDAASSDSVSENRRDAITSSFNSGVTLQDSGDESQTGFTSEKSRVTWQVGDKQHEMQRDQSQETRTTPFSTSYDTSQLPVDIRTIAATTEKTEQIQDSAPSRPNCENLGGLSHCLSTALSADDSQQPTQTMTQLSKYPGQGQERLSKFSQQGHNSARMSATSLETVQQIPSHESQMFIKYVEQGTSAQSFCAYSCETSQSQTEANVNVDNSHAMQALLDYTTTGKQNIVSNILALRKTASEQTHVDKNGNIQVITPAESTVGENNTTNIFPEQATYGELYSTDSNTQGNTQAAAYAVDTRNKNEFIENTEAKLSEVENKNTVVSKRDTPVKRKMIAPLMYETSEEDNDNEIGIPLLTPKHEPVCDQIVNPNLRVELNGRQAEAFKGLLDRERTLSSPAGTEVIRNINLENCRENEIRKSEMSQALFAPTPVRQQIYGFLQQTDSSNKVYPPIMTPLAAKDIANRHGGNGFFSPYRKPNGISGKENSLMRDNTAGAELETKDISDMMLKCETDQEQTGQEPKFKYSLSPEIDSCGAVDLSKSARKKKHERQNGGNSVGRNQHNMRLSPYSPRPRVSGSAFQPVRPSRLTPDIGSLSLYGNMQTNNGNPRHHSKNGPILHEADTRYEEAMLDEEVARYFRQGLLEVSPGWGLCDDPVAKTLLGGDDMHFIPICEELEMEETDGHLEDSAFTKCHRST